jgi:pimeloyl-ACP methyl ester carboxylesterase
MTLSPSTYVIVPGAGDAAANWELVAARLRGHGQDVVAVDLPSDDPTATFSDYADVVVEAIGDRTGVVVVGHSLGGFTAPLVADRVDAELLVLVSAMVPRPGETAGDWWSTSGYTEATRDQDQQDDEIAVFMHDVPPALAAVALARGRVQAGRPMEVPWPLAAWPDVPTRFLLCRDDRFFPAAFVRRMVEERLGLVPDEIDGSHSVYLSRPRELADRLQAYVAERAGAR